VYDHFLATDENEFSEESLLDFSKQVYTSMDNYLALLPEKFGMMYPYMKEHNWLYNYRSRWGTGKSLGGVVRRSLHLTESDTAFQLFEEHYQQLQLLYFQFWPDLKQFARQQFETLRI
jgi:acyl carrier protein phosphodiesterase